MTFLVGGGNRNTYDNYQTYSPLFYKEVVILDKPTGNHKNKKWIHPYQSESITRDKVLAYSLVEVYDKLESKILKGVPVDGIKPLLEYMLKNHPHRLV